MYDLKELKELVTNRILVYPLTAENVMDVAFSVDNYQQFSLVEVVWKRCSDFLYKNVFTTMNAVSSFASSYHNQDSRKGLIALKLLATPTRCRNCVSIHCLDGTRLKPPFNANMQSKKCILFDVNGREKYSLYLMTIVSSALEEDGTIIVTNQYFEEMNWKPERMAWRCK